VRGHSVGALPHRLRGLPASQGQTLHVATAQLPVLPPLTPGQLSRSHQPSQRADGAVKDARSFSLGDRVSWLRHGPHANAHGESLVICLAAA
jgi:hypothetical protein